MSSFITSQPTLISTVNHSVSNRNFTDWGTIPNKLKHWIRVGGPLYNKSAVLLVQWVFPDNRQTRAIFLEPANNKTTFNCKNDPKYPNLLTIPPDASGLIIYGIQYLYITYDTMISDTYPFVSTYNNGEQATKGVRIYDLAFNDNKSKKRLILSTLVVNNGSLTGERFSKMKFYNDIVKSIEVKDNQLLRVYTTEPIIQYSETYIEQITGTPSNNPLD